MNNSISSVVHYIRNEIGWTPFLFAIIMCGKTLGFHIPLINQASYLALIIVSIICLRHGITFDNLMGAFLLFIPISLALAGPDPIFQSWMRYGLFLLLCFSVSPLLTNDYSKEFKLRVFKVSLICCSAISAISFVCYFLGINMMRNTYDGSELDYLVNTAGTFGGITSQSMLLGPISGVGMLTCSYMAMNRNKYYWILAIMCGGSLLFAASRSSLIATICGEMVLLYFSSRNLNKNIRRILGIGVLLLVTYPVWNGALTGLEAKNQGPISSGINTYSRNTKWEYRIEEWEDSPIYGIGFCSVSDRDQIGYNGMIEPGSSWLAVLSMTGAVGFILLSMIFYHAGKNALSPRTPEGALIGSVLILLGVHMMAEGHIFSAGSYLCFLVWLSIGCATDYEYFKINKRT